MGLTHLVSNDVIISCMPGNQTSATSLTYTRDDAKEILPARYDILYEL